MSIRFRLVVLFSLVLSVLLALGFYAASMFRHDRAEADEIWVHTRDELAMAYRAKVAFDSQQLAWANLIVRGQEPARYYEYLSAFYASERETRDAIDALLSVHGEQARHHHPSGRDHLESARRFQDVYRALGRQYREALEVYNASDEPVFEADRYVGEAVENPSSLIDEMIDQIIDHHRTEIKSMNASVDAQLRRLWIGAALVLLFAMATVLWFTYYRVGRPLGVITDVAQDIRDGGIQRRVPRQSGEEFGVLGETLNAMLDRLESANRSLSGKVRELEQEIDHRQSIEAALAAKTDELREANGELEAFSYTIAHDLRSPLRAITGFSQMLQEDLKGNIEPEDQDALDRVSAAGLRMADQIDHILELSRINRNELTL
jgi:methyl-accepting chemotaxis protein